MVIRESREHRERLFGGINDYEWMMRLGKGYFVYWNRLGGTKPR